MSKISEPTQTPNQKNVLTFPAGAAAGATATAASSKAQLRDNAFTSAGMPAGYTADENGIYELRETKEDAISVRICSPLVVKGRCRNAVGHGWGRVLTVQDPDGTWHELVIDTQQLTKSASVALGPLYDLGFELAPVEKAAESVMNLLSTWRPEDQYLRFDRLGWTDNSHDAFVLGSGHVIGNALVATDSVSEHLMAAIHTKGTLAAWKKEVAAPCVGNPLLMLAVAHAFTGPLLSVLGLTGGGFHLRGLSSRGKSSIQYVATSVWGARSLLQSWDGTPSGFEGIAAACNDTLLNIEELHKADPKTVGDIVYMLANGQGRLRAKSNGKLQTPQRWRVPILSSGEVSLEEHMASAGRKMFAGQDVRLINLEADSRAEGAFDMLHGSENSKVFAERVDRACLENYGHAGPLFVENLMRNIDKVESLLALIHRFCNSVAVARRMRNHPLANPVILSVLIIAPVLWVTKTEYATYFEGAQFIHFLLGPATIALALPLWDNRETIRTSVAPILLALVAGSVTAAGSAILLAQAFGLSSEVILSLAPKSTTAPVALGISEAVGGLPALTAVLVILTGIIGAVIVTPLMTVLRINDWRARGFSVGLAVA